VFVGLIVSLCVLGALGGGGWYATTRGLVTLPPAVAQLVERVIPSAPIATAATVPEAPLAAVDTVARPARLAADSAPAAAQQVARATKPRVRQPVDTEPDDGLHPRVKVDLRSHAARGAVQMDAITRAIDRAEKASLDSVERARLGLRPTAPRRP
jgi:hypothetical protein